MCVLPTEAMLCEELECLLGAREEMLLTVSWLRVLGLIICRPGTGPGTEYYISHQPHASITKQNHNTTKRQKCSCHIKSFKTFSRNITYSTTLELQIYANVVD